MRTTEKNPPRASHAMTAMDRRTFVRLAAAGAVAGAVAGAATLAGGVWAGRAEAAVSDAPPPLPYAEDALEPVISARTVSFHYGKHTAGYYAKTARFTKGTRYEDMALEDIVKTANFVDEPDVYNNAAQAWNHTFYWNGLRPGSGAPEGRLARALEGSFGSVDGFRQAMLDAAGGVFGSGWGWLVADGDRLSVLATRNAYTPLSDGLTPLWCVDVWEHAYYLDYQNRRGEHITKVMDSLLDWRKVAERLG